MDKAVILVVDDEPDICSELQMFLTHKSYTVITASNGIEAFEKFKTINPDIVLTDYKMPAMNGFELMLKIKGINKNTGIILMSAIVDLDPFIMTKNSAEYEFMHKPIDLEALLQIVTRMKNSHHRTDRNEQ
jgi:DNA-binding NtrC family response regulator